jgi:hypothetical protein
LEDQHKVLEPFRQLTEDLQSRAGKGRNGSVWETLPAIEALLEHVERLKAQQVKERASEPIRSALNNTWKVLKKYYNLTDAVPTVYFAATVLNPTLRMQYFDDRWGKEPGLKRVLDKHKKTLTAFWKKEYSTRATTTLIPVIPRKRTLLETFLYRDSITEIDELTAYLKEPVTVLGKDERLNLFQWWDNHKVQYPTLSQMAFDLLSIPAMSAECERVFSGAGVLLTSRKKSMKEDTIEAVECLRTWWIQELICHVSEIQGDDEVADNEVQVEDEDN